MSEAAGQVKALSSARPPSIELTDPLRWVLLAAFSQEPPRGPTAEEAELIASLAERLGLMERIATRYADRSLPEALRTPLRRKLNRSAATCLLYERMAHELAAVAADLDIPLVFLKGFAVFLLETSPPGSRPFGDLDILVPPAHATTLFEALRERDFEPVAGDTTEQHLPALRSLRGGVLEIHFALRGLRRRDSAAATFDDLARWQMIERASDFEGECFLPMKDLLASHLLVHTLQQHLLRPQSYQLFRVIGDLIDLLPSDHDWIDLEAAREKRYELSVTPSDVEATKALCQELAAGRLPFSGDDDTGRLFSHLIASSLDQQYAETLASRYLGQRLLEARRYGELSGYLRRKIFGTNDPLLGPAIGLGGRVQRITRGIGRQIRALIGRLR